jgi:two-component system, sensor histidine kinase and response regulator
MSILYFKGKRGIVVREQGEKLILVVEDSDVLRKLLARLIFQMGFSTDTAVEGLEAVEKASTGAYDLILMDLSMPGMDGYQATQKIREHECRAQMPRAVIVAVSAYGTKDQCLKCGMDDYISKPVDPVQLSRVLDRWLTARRRFDWNISRSNL